MASGGSGHRVLVVEDSPTQAAALRGELERAGYEVRVATDGESALAAAREAPPDLVISDILMPGMDGFELCAALRAEPATADVPIILRSRLEGPRDILRGLRSGANAFLPKTTPAEVLLEQAAYLVAARGRRGRGASTVEVELVIEGTPHRVAADSMQMLDMLLASYAALDHQLDATERALDEARRLAQRLERANRELREFASAVSHDLRAPLRAIRGFAEALEEELGGASVPDAARDHLRRIRAAGERMDRLLGALLDYLRLGTVTPKQEAVPVAEVAHEVLELLRHEAERRGASLQVVVDDVVVLGDRDFLARVLQNLVDNAIRYGGSPPAVTVRAGREGDRAVVEVRDRGPGIPADQIGRALEPFARLVPEEVEPGSGLGLAVVARCVEAMGGSLRLESAPGEGTVARVELPAAEEAA